MLVSAYIQIIISVVFAPIQIMFGAIPGNNAFGSWLRNLVANLGVFAITVVLMILGGYLANTVSAGGQLWAPPGIGGNLAEGVAGLIGFGMALSIPQIVASFKQAIGAKPAVAGGASLLFAPISTIMSGGQQALSLGVSLKHLRGGPGPGH